MSLLMENAYAKLGCGDPGDPIEFGALFTGSQILQRTPTVTGNRRLVCFSEWAKRSDVGTAQTLFGRTSAASSNSDYLQAFVLSSGEIDIGLSTGLTVQGKVRTTSRFKGVAAFYHRHIVLDLDNPDPAERIRIKINGVRQEVDILTAVVAVDLWVNVAGIPFYIGANSGYGSADYYRKENVCETIWFDGFAPDATEFGYFNAYGQWRPKTFAGKGGGAAVYGLNGLHLDYADQGDMGKDVSGCGNHMTVVGSLEQITDTPTQNFVTLNPNSASGSVAAGMTSVSSGYARSTMFDRGEFQYFEAIPSSAPSALDWVGVFESESKGYVTWYGDGYIHISQDGQNETITAGPTYSSNDVIGVLCDFDGQTVTFTKNGLFQFEKPLDFGKILATVFASNAVWKVKFKEFQFATSDTLEWSTQNLRCPEILDPSRYYKREQLIGGADLDLNWNPLTSDTIVFSGRIDSAQEFRVNMIIGGVQVNPFNTAGVGGEIVGEDGLTFHSGGATVGAATEYQGTCRHRAIRCTPTSGMALVTINHVNGTPTIVDHTAGGVAEEITFFPVGGGDRREYHKAIGGDAYRRVNGPGVTADSGFITGNIHNRFVADGSLPTGRYHVWVKRSVAQFSAAFTYEGNNSATDGTFMPFDFEPALLMGRRLSSPGDYFIKDNLSANPNTEIIRLDSTSGVGGPDWDIDFYSNGAKWFDATNTTTNYGGTYAGFAIAKTPIKFANEV